MRRTLLVLLPLWLAACVREAPIEGAACDPEHLCPGGFSCTAGACRKLAAGPLARCDDDDDCAIGVCLEAAGFCVQCEIDADCGEAACIAGAYVCGCRQDLHCVTGRCDEASGVCVSCLASEQCPSGICDVTSGVCGKVDQSEADAATQPEDAGDAEEIDEAPEDAEGSPGGSR